MVESNMQMRNAASDPVMVKDHYQAVIAEVEKVYTCLGVTCADLGSMLSSFPPNPGPPLWATCTDADLPRAPCKFTRNLPLLVIHWARFDRCCDYRLGVHGCRRAGRLHLRHT